MTRYLCFTRVFSKENVSQVSSEAQVYVKTSRCCQSNCGLIPKLSVFPWIWSHQLFCLLAYLQSHLGNVLVDMKLIDIKDTLPVGFIPIQETVDTRM